MARVLNIASVLKPLVAQLRKLKIGDFLHSDDFSNLVLERDWDVVWDVAKKEIGKTVRVLHISHHDSTIETDALAIWLNHVYSQDVDAFEDILSSTISAFVKWNDGALDLAGLNQSVQALGLHSGCRAVLEEAGRLSAAKANGVQKTVPNEKGPQSMPSVISTSKPRSVRVWYIFIDVVEFTAQGRHMDDMVTIITTLNTLVKALLVEYVHTEKVIILATGDGMCLGLLDSSPNLQIQLAFALRDKVQAWNEGQSISKLQFQLRTALNIYDDYQIMDINDKPNLIGHGINTAARILSLGRPSEIIVSEHMYQTIYMDGKFAGSFSPLMQDPVKGQSFTYRRIELLDDRRDWLHRKSDGQVEQSVSAPGLDAPLNLGASIVDPLANIRGMQQALSERSTLTAQVGEPLEHEEAKGQKVGHFWPKPEVLLDEPIADDLLNDNRLRRVVVQDLLWVPSAMDSTPALVLGHTSYSKEFSLGQSFRSFGALVSPNSDNFKLVLKLMNTTGTLSAHMVFGEASFILSNTDQTDTVLLGYKEAGVSYVREVEVKPRPRFEVRLEVIPVRSSKLVAARLSINKKLVQTKMVPREFTERFGLVASGHGKPCHMSLSEICVKVAAK